MATENRGVMVYLPPDVEEYMTNFCTEYNITRKDKEGTILPSLGTGVVTYLRSKMSGESPEEILTKPSKLLGNGLSKDEVLDLIREYTTNRVDSDIPSEELSTGLTESRVIDLINSSRLSSLPLTVEEIDSRIDTAVSMALVPIRDEMRAEIEAIKECWAGTPPRSLSNRVESPVSIAPQQIEPVLNRELKSSIEDESKDVHRAYKQLKEINGLKDAFIAAVSVHGKSSQAIADALFAQNPEWGRDSQGQRMEYSTETISRMRKALAYIDRE